MNQHDAAMLSAYYRARREVEPGERIPRAALTEALAIVECETDIGIAVLQNVDDYYLKLYADEIKRMRSKP